MKVRSTNTALVKILDEIRKSKYDHKISFLILLVFTKAFNCINFVTLHLKLINSSNKYF
jgi:hypothetical protein